MMETNTQDLEMGREVFERKLSTWEKLSEEKRIRTRERNIETVVRSLKTKPFCQSQFEKVSGDSCHIGDYGNLVSDINDFELNIVFDALGIVDQDGETIKVNTLRKLIEGKKGQERRMSFHDQETRVKLSVDFFSENSDVNFDTWIDNLNENDSQKVIDKFNGLEIETVKEKLITSLIEPESEWIPLAIDEKENKYLFETMKRYVDESWNGLELKKDETGKMVKWVKNEKDFDGLSDNRQFITTKTARDFLWALDVCNLVPGKHLISAISEGFCGDERTFNSRYGNGFAELTRLLANYVGKDTGEWIFEDGSFETGKIDILRKIGRTKGMAEGASLALDLMSQVIVKDDNREDSFSYYRSGLGLHGSGACEDSEYYLVSETDEGEVSKDDNFVYFYGHGRLSKGDYDVFGEYMMAMSRKEIVVNGVKIPPGFLCRVSENRAKIEPLRASMFCFDEEISKEVFGKQFDKFIGNGGNFSIGRDLLI